MKKLARLPAAALHEQDVECVIFHEFTNITVTAIDVFGTIVELRIIGQIDGCFIVYR